MYSLLEGREPDCCSHAGGRIAGDIRINGFPREQKTWARVSGYVEQSDIHSPQATVEEALWFSARLRLTRDTPNKVMWAFIYEVRSKTFHARPQTEGSWAIGPLALYKHRAA